MKILILALFLFSFVSWESIGQELKSKRKQTEEYIEEYTVLKDDKKVKHGQYVRYEITPFGHTVLQAVGIYNQGKKSDNWVYFSRHGYLENEGQYSNDQPEGLWVEYYEPEIKRDNTLQTINSAFEVNKGIVIKENGEIEIDRSAIIKSAEGTYHLGKKVGIWEYFSRNGSLIHKYDHSSMLLLADNGSDGCPYLGGFTRFNYKFNNLEKSIPWQNSKVTLKIPSQSSSEEIQTIEWTGDYAFAKRMQNIFTALRAEFIKSETIVTISCGRNEEDKFSNIGFDFGSD